jgi:hypothetical protein
MKNTLHLNLKKQWFDMILSGEKKEEYRDLSTYWETRLINFIFDQVTEFKKFDTITFSNGYAKDRPQFIIKLKNIRIDFGKPIWGANPKFEYFVLELGEIVQSNKSNVKK